MSPETIIQLYGDYLNDEEKLHNMYRYINSVHRISVVALSAVALYLFHVIHTHAIFDIANLGFSKYSVVYSFSFIGTDHVMLAVPSLSFSITHSLERAKNSSKSSLMLKVLVGFSK